MKQVVNILKRNEVEKRKNILHLEIDYELLTLHDAIVANDEKQIKESKRKLEQYRKELLELQ